MSQLQQLSTHSQFGTRSLRCPGILFETNTRNGIILSLNILACTSEGHCLF